MGKSPPYTTCWLGGPNSMWTNSYSHRIGRALRRPAEWLDNAIDQRYLHRICTPQLVRTFHPLAPRLHDGTQNVAWSPTKSYDVLRITALGESSTSRAARSWRAADHLQSSSTRRSVRRPPRWIQLSQCLSYLTVFWPSPRCYLLRRASFRTL